MGTSWSGVISISAAGRFWIPATRRAVRDSVVVEAVGHHAVVELAGSRTVVVTRVAPAARRHSRHELRRNG
jgi:hypothetical protein